VRDCFTHMWKSSEDGIILGRHYGWWHWPTTMSHVYNETKKYFEREEERHLWHCGWSMSQCHQPQCHPRATRRWCCEIITRWTITTSFIEYIVCDNQFMLVSCSGFVACWLLVFSACFAHLGLFSCWAWMQHLYERTLLRRQGMIFLKGKKH